MLAFVLSGGGNYGAMQVGALKVLLEAGIKPQMLVGTSAGALNAIYLSTNLTKEGAEKLENLWLHAKPTEMGLTAIFEVVGNIAHRKESLFSNKKLLEYLKLNLPKDIITFGDLQKKYGIAVYTTAVGVSSRKLRVFGDSPEDTLIDGALASTALPPYYPPWKIDNHHYIDGGALAKLPISVAVKRGADEIIALDIRDIVVGEGDGMLDTAAFTLSIMTQQQTDNQLRWARNKGVKVHYLPLKPEKIRFWDFSQAKVLIESGSREAEKFLNKPGLQIPSGPTLKYRINKIIKDKNLL